MNIKIEFKSLKCKIKPKKVNHFVHFANILVIYVLSQCAETQAHK